MSLYDFVRRVKFAMQIMRSAVSFIYNLLNFLQAMISIAPCKSSFLCLDNLYHAAHLCMYSAFLDWESLAQGESQSEPSLVQSPLLLHHYKF